MRIREPSVNPPNIEFLRAEWRRSARSPEIFTLSHTAAIWHIEPMTSVSQELDRLHASVCKGLADPKRLLIINTLRDGPMSVTEICDTLELAQSNVSQHLAILRDKGLVNSRRDGQFVYYSLTSMKIIEAMDLLREVMAAQYTSAQTVESKTVSI